MTSNFPNPTLAVHVAKALDSLVADVRLISESDRPYRPFYAALAPDRELTVESFRETVKIGARYRIDVGSVEDWFSYYTDRAEHGATAKLYVVLEQIMRATLSDLRIIHVRGEGVVKVRFFLFGRLPDGSLTGLRSIAIET